MKILHVMAGAEFGGAETAFVDICLAMHESGSNILIVTRANDLRVRKLRDAGITVHTLPFGGKIDIYTKWKLTKIIKSFKPDIIQCWMSRAPTKVPRWNEKMGIKAYSIVARMGGYYKMKYYKSADYFVANTPDISSYIHKQGINKNNIRYISNYTQIEPVKTSISKADLNTPEDATVLIALGRLHTVKAFDTLIKTASQLNNVYVWIAGEGEERDKLQKLAQELDCADRIKFLGWRDDRAALFEAADICVMPSRFEPFGNVFIQAWAQKIPLVISKSEGPSQFIRDGIDCLAFDIDDEEGMKAAIEKLINDPKLAKKLVQNGFEHFQKSFTKEQCVAEYFEYYRQISEKAKPPQQIHLARQSNFQLSF